MGSDLPVTPMLISFRHPFNGATEANCHACKATVYEHRENLDIVTRGNGFVVCDLCALRMKLMAPDRIQILAQLFAGQLREPEPTDDTKPFLDFMNKEPRK
jgi:hypothetical protein